VHPHINQKNRRGAERRNEARNLPPYAGTSRIRFKGWISVSCRLRLTRNTPGSKRVQYTGICADHPK